MGQRRHRTIRMKGAIAAAQRQRVPPRGARLVFQADPWTRRLIRPVLITALATSFTVAMLVIVATVTPDGPWPGLTILAAFSALEGAYTTMWLTNPDSRGVERGTYRAAEVLLLVVLCRIASWILFGIGIPSPAEMRVYLGAPFSLLTTGGFFTTLVAALGAWWLSITFSRIFAHLEVSLAEVQFYTLSPAEQKAQADDRPIQTARARLQTQYLRFWLWGGMLIVIMAALSTYDVREVATVSNPFEIARLGMNPAMLMALLTYFLAGLWLLSHARMLRLNALWLMDGVAKEASVERGWQRGSLLIILAIALAAGFLPIGSTLAISRLLSVLVKGAFYLVGLIYALFGLLFGSLLASLSNGAEQQPPIQTPQPVPTPFIPPSPPPASNPFFGLLISSAFWALLVALVIGAFMFFLRERGYHVELKQVKSTWRQFTGWLKRVWLDLQLRWRRASHALRQRFSATSPESSLTHPRGARRPRFFRLGALSPRDQIRYYYLAAVRRAGERGVVRKVNETPLEYARALKQNWPEAEDELEGLTSAFIKARYSTQAVDKSAAGRIKETWNRLRARLRSR